MDDFKRGYEFGRFALELAERSKDPSILCKVLYIFAAMIKPWRDPLDESFPLFGARAKAGARRRRSPICQLCAIISASSSRGSLPANQPALKCYVYVKSIGRSSSTPRTWLHSNLSRCARTARLPCRARPQRPIRSSDGAYDETASELHYRRTGNLTLVFFQYLVRLQLACLFGRYRGCAGSI